MKSATLYRMVMEHHLCPYGLKAKRLLEREGFEVNDNWLESSKATEAFKDEQNVETTPQIFIGGERIGGYDALRKYLNDDSDRDSEFSYRPIIAIFTVALLMALATSSHSTGYLFTIRAAEWFIAFSMCLLAVQKLQDLENFTTTFLNYDLLSRRWVRYAYLYPFAEAGAGILMIADALIWIASPVALFIGTVGAVSVFKAVYIDRRELKCGCVGGNSNVPLGFISLTENLMMMVMGIWMIMK